MAAGQGRLGEAGVSGHAFDRLLYTDCRPGEGLGGGGGYQIQAQSSGCSPALARLAVGWLLYSPQARWVNSGRPVAESPDGLAHCAAAGYGTGQSRYLGQEANGNRQGNYVADCLLTEDIGPYGMIRPAQLWQAPFWRAEAWPTTTAPAFDQGIDIGPLDHDAIAEWLRAEPQRVTGLQRLLTVLEDATGPRVIIRAEDPEAALYWIAASTILLPLPQGLEVSFRVFANNIDEAPHRIVAVPLELYPSLRPGSRPRAFIIDATTDETDEVVPSNRAGFWVKQLAEAEEPYDVVEAVDLAADFGGATEQERADARLAALAVVDPGSPIRDAPGVGRWVRRTLGTVHDRAAQSVIGRLITADGVPVDDLYLLDQRAAVGTISANAAGIRMRLLTAEVERAAAGAPSAGRKLDPVPLSQAQRADGTSAVGSAIILGSDRAVDLLLRVAWQHGLELDPPSPALLHRLRGFVTDWVRSPHSELRVDSWALRDLLTDELHDQLRHVYQAGDEGTLQRALPAAVGCLTGRYDLADRFTAEVEACWTARLKPGQRSERIGKVVTALLGTGTEDWFADYQAALVRWEAVDPATALDVAGLIPAAFSLSEAIRESATRELQAKADDPDARVIMAVSGLAARGALPDDPRLRRIARSAAAVDAFRHTPDADALRRLGEADEDILELAAPVFAGVAIQAAGPALGQRILRVLPKRPARSFARAWQGYLDDPDRGPVAAAYSIAWLLTDSIPADARRQLEQQLRAVAATGHGAWHAAVGRLLRSEEERSLLDQLLEGSPGAGGPPRGSGLRHGSLLRRRGQS
jgi:hypothetical protein